MVEVNPSDQGDRRLAIREPVAKPLEVPDAQVARMSGHVEMSKVEKNRTNASDGSLRHYQPTNQADSLPADWEEQNTSLELQDGDISVSRSNKLKEANLVNGSSKNSKGEPYEVYTAEASQAVKKLDSHQDDLNVAMAAAETLDTPITSAQRAGVTALAPLFFFEGGGKPLDSAAAKQMKLDRMTAEELKMLGIERKEMLMPEVFKEHSYLELQKAQPDLLGLRQHAENLPSGQEKPMTIGQHSYSSNNLLAYDNQQSGLVTDGTNATAAKAEQELDKRSMYNLEVERKSESQFKTGVGYLENYKKPEITEQEVFERVASLPLHHQAIVLSAGIQAYHRELNDQQFRMVVGHITGVGETVVGVAQ